MELPHRGYYLHVARIGPVSVAVLVDLVRTPDCGGHVKCWEQLARAAAGVPEVDLSIYVLGHRPGTEEVAENVRFVALRPVLSSGLVRGLIGGVDDGDLAPFHPGLARRLPQHTVWHLTHSLTFAATALRLARRHHRPITGSVHTDVPMLTGIYTRQVVAHLPRAVRSAARVLDAERHAVALARRRRDRVLRACGHLLASNPADAHEFAAVAPGALVSMLRRGIDTGLFSPGDGDRAARAARAGLPADQHLVLFAGRIDATKGAPMLAQAIGRLRSAGVPAHLVLAGSGAAAGQVAADLGDGATLLGHLSQEQLARVYASCDVLAFPSRSETAGNVVAEAMACGLPALLPRGGRTAQWLRAPGEDGVLVGGDDPATWAAAIGTLLADPARRRAMGRRARLTVERTVPTWVDVVHEDLLPVWREAAGVPAARVSVTDRLPVAVSQ